MTFDLRAVLGDMVVAVKENTKDETGKIGKYAKMVMDKEKASLEELAQARLANEITERELVDEVEREKKVLQAELLTLEIMGKAMTQKAVNAAMNVFVNAVKLAI